MITQQNIPFIRNPYSKYNDRIRVDVFVKRIFEEWGTSDPVVSFYLCNTAKDIYSQLDNHDDKSLFIEEFMRQTGLNPLSEQTYIQIQKEYDELTYVMDYHNEPIDLCDLSQY